MRQEQMTNEADGESIRVTQRDDGSVVVEVAPSDADGHPEAWAGWTRLVYRDPDGDTDYHEPADGWTETRTATVNSLLRMVC